MLRILLRLLSNSSRKTASWRPDTPNTHAPNTNAANTKAPGVILYARVDPVRAESPLVGRRNQGKIPQPVPTLPIKATHRQRLLSMRLEHTRICSPQRCQRLIQFGIVSAGDLAHADLEKLTQRFGAPGKALRVLKQYRRAIRFAAAVPGMMPRDAMLLISIHRRSVRGLAMESPAMLHRDLERFAESSQGRLQLRGRRLPSTRRLKRWINECGSYRGQSPLQARAA